MATKKDYYNIDNAYKLGTTTTIIKIISKKEKEQIMEINKIINEINDAIDCVNNDILFEVFNRKLDANDYENKEDLTSDLDDLVYEVDDAIDQLARLLQELETIFDKID